MYPYVARALAQERTRDMHNDAVRDHRARKVRLARRARGAEHAHSALGRVRMPDSYEDFLCQTAEAAMREPTASGRATGQTIR